MRRTDASRHNGKNAANAGGKNSGKKEPLLHGLPRKAADRLFVAEKTFFRYTDAMSGNTISGAKGGSLSFENYPKQQQTPDKQKGAAAKRIAKTQEETRRSIGQSDLGRIIDMQA